MTDTKDKVFNWFKSQKSGINLVQETHSTNVIAAEWKKEWDGTSVWNSRPTNQSAGLVILINKD